MNQLLKIFYIGRKPEKRDTVNPTPGARGRIWKGFGASLMVPQDEAAVLTTYEDVWCSEDAFPEFELQRENEAAAAALSAARIKAREEATAEEMRLLSKASEELDGKTQAQDDGSDEMDRDTLLRSAILLLDPSNEDDYTKTKPQKPRVDRITEITSASFSAAEITVAFQELIASGSIKLPA